MPEGDTIFRTARTLRRALVGGQVTAARTTVGQVRALGVGRLVGQSVAAVESRGKHLLIWFAPSDLALHSHMMMSGSWHAYAPGERWRKPERLARFVLETPAVVAVCFSAPVVELLSRSQVERHRSLAALGPDALAAVDQPGVDLAEARRRLDTRAQLGIAEALLDQRVLAGVGNVFKCEVCFLHGVDPWTPVGTVPGEVRDAMLATAVALLQANVAPGALRRTTTGDPLTTRGPRLHVYGRARRPCTRCATPIRVARQGAQARLTYWCPRCQGPGPGR
jgi:endonuclease VIII